HCETGVEAGKNRARRSVVEDTGEPAIVGERTAGLRSEKSAAKFSNYVLFPSARNYLEHRAINVSSPQHGGDRAPVSVAEFFAVKRICRGIVPAFFDHSPEILLGKQQQNDRAERIARAGGRHAHDLARK